MAKNPFEDPKFGTETSDAGSQGAPQPQKRKNVFEDEDYGKDPGVVRSVGDTAVSAAQGLVRGAEMVSSAVDAGSSVSKGLREADEYLGGFKSGGRRAEQDARAAKIEEAEESGSTWEEVKAYGGAFLEAPIDTTVESLGTAAPAIAANVITRGRAGVAVGGGISGAQGAGATKSSIYESVKNEHLQAGATEEEAEARASEAQSYTGENADQIGVGAGLGVLAGTTGIEPAAGRIAGRLPGVLAGKEGSGVVASTAKGMVKEAPLEAAQGGHEQLAANLALQNEGFEQPTWQGVAGSAVMEGMAGSVAGGAFGAAEGFASRNQREQAAADGNGEPDPQGEPSPTMGEQAQEFQQPQQTAPVQSAPATEPTPEWTSPGPVPEPYRTETLVEPQPLPSEQMGLDPAAGPMSEAATIAVDSGLTQQLNPGAAPELGVQPSFLDGQQVDANTGELLSPQDPQPEQRQDQAQAGPEDPEARRALIQRRLEVIGNQARANGWTAPLIAERNRAQQELDSLQPEPSAVDLAASEAATSPTNALPEPTEAQKEAGNYKKGHVRVQGLDVTIENPRGSVRKGKRPDGTEWQHEMSDHYGYIRRTKGADSEQVDVYVGPQEDATQVFVIDQLDQQTGQFDEHKVMMGYPTQQAAVVAYKSNFDPDWQVGPVRPMNVDEFKGWLKGGDTSAPASTAPVTAPAESGTGTAEPGAVDIQEITRKQIPDMSDAEIEAAITHYGEGHKRTKKLVKERNRRRLAAKAKAPNDNAVSDADGYQQRSQQRRDQIEAATTEQEVDQILSEHAADPAGHVAGYQEVEQAAKRRKEAIANPPEPGIVDTSGSERQAQGMVEQLERENPGKSYRVERRQGGFGEYYAVIDNQLNPPKDAGQSSAEASGDGNADAIRDQIGQIADRWENEVGDAQMAQVIRAGLRTPKAPTEENLAFQQGKLDEALARMNGTEAPVRDDFTLESVLEGNDREAKDFQEAKANPELTGLYEQAERVVQDVVNYLNDRGFSMYRKHEMPADLRQIADRTTGLTGTMARVGKKAVAVMRGYKRANPADVQASVKEAQKSINALHQMIGQSPVEFDRSVEVEAKPRNLKEGIERARKKKAEEKQAAREKPASTAPEHLAVGVDERELGEIVSEFKDAQSAMLDGDFKMHHLFDAPAKSEIVRLQDKVKVYNKDHGWMTPAEAKARIAEWKENAAKQGDQNRVENSNRVVLSLFDYTGKWSQPWEEAGYQVYRFDIQQESMAELMGEDVNIGDVHNFGHEYFADLFGHFDGNDVYAILAACPCTDFASSGARHFAAKDKDGRTVASVKLVHQTLATVEYFKPAVWAIENPVGRIEKLTGLPPWRLSFDPNHIGDPYTKKTLLWGRFNGDLPIAPVEPTEGSKMHSKYGGKSMATKNARSATPEGFAYGFFQANNAVDHPVMAAANKYDRLDRGLIEQAIESGMTEANISEVVDDHYFMDLDDQAAEAALKEAIAERTAEAGPEVNQEGWSSPEIAREVPERVKAIVAFDGAITRSQGWGGKNHEGSPAGSRAWMSGWSESGSEADQARQEANKITDPAYHGGKKFPVSPEQEIALISALKAEYAGVDERFKLTKGSPRRQLADAIADAPMRVEAFGNNRYGGEVRILLGGGFEGYHIELGGLWPEFHTTTIKHTESGQTVVTANGAETIIRKLARIHHDIQRGVDPLSGEQEASPEKARKLDSASAKLSDAKKKAALELKALLDSRLGTLNMGVDPEVMLAVAKVGALTVADGTVKFAVWVRDVINTTRAVGIDDEQVKPFLKEAYGAIASNPEKYDISDDLADAMDAPRDIRRMDIDGIVNEMPQDEGVNTNEQQADGAGSDSDPQTAQGAGSGRRNDPQQGSAPVDSGQLETEQSENVGEPAGGQSGGRSGVRSSTGNVSGTGQAGSPGNAGQRREAGSGEGGSASGARGGRKPESISPNHPGVGNFHIDDPKAIVGGGQVSRFKKNQAAIEVYNQIRDESRQATREEQEILAGYTGWGSFGQELFQGSWTHPQPKAGWEARDKWLRDHLGEDEWKGLQRSIINAHYTDPPTVQAMWSMVQRMGFKGGRVLEPSMGIGNFFGMMPPALKNRSQLAGIELDPVTGGMAKLLYPDANVQVMGYQDSKTPDDFYDVIIGNWPFENSPIADRRYNRLNPFVHDYFFLKAMDQVRPGGIVMAITSAGSMDKKNTTIRRELAKKGELIDAFRLPSGAFEEYAGTKVVTDIIILRKRPEPIMDVSGEGWIQVAEVDTPAGQKITVNEYYANNPDKVLGTLNFGSGSTYGRPSMIVDRPADLEARLQQAVESLPESAYLKSTRAETISYVTNHTDDREGAITVNDGKLFIVRGEYLAPAEEVASWAVKDPKKTQAREQQLRDAINLRNHYAQLLDAEVRQEGADAARGVLNDAYQAFVKAHGNLSDSYALKYMKKVQDPFYHSLAALEVERNGKRVPATILTRSTMRRKPPIKNPSIQDAFILARGTEINPSMEDVAELAGTDAETARKTLVDSGAVFELPGGDTEPSDLYLSGNVRVKYRQAKQALEMGNAAMERNVKALEAVLPPTVPYYNIEVQLGATWIPSSVYEQFVAHMLNEPDTKGISATFTNGLWKIRLDPKLGGKREAETGFGTKHYPFRQLVNAAISNQVVTIKKTIDDGGSKTSVVDYEATDAANNKIREMRESFGDWLWQDQQRRMDLEEEYNETRNAYAEPRYDGSFMPFDGMALQLGENDFNLRKHQVNAIWRGLVTRRSLNAHEVGTGKSFTIAGIAVESRRYGIARKPLILGHNANSKSLAADITAMYPSAKVLYIDNLQPSVIDTKLRQIANDDWDAVVIPHSLLGRLSFKEETLMAMAQEEIEGLEAEARLAAEEDGVSFNDDMLDDEDALKKLRSPTAKDLVKTRNRIIESIKKQSQRSSKPGAVAFEDLGVDMVLVDEAHEFKKPPFRTKMRMKGLQTATSDKSIALKFVTDYIRMANNGGNVHLFTGTPITNTLTEVFHQMRYIMAEEMREIGVDQWDGWFGSFAKEVDDVELDGAGNYETVTRLRGFVNVPELRKMIGQYMDVVFANDMPEMKPRRTKSGKTMADELTEAETQELYGGYTEGAADRPYKKVVTENADLTPEQQEVFNYVRKLAREFKEAQGKQRMEWMRTGDPHSPIIYEGIANRASFDVRLVQDEKLAGMEGKVPDDPNSKISRAIRNIKEIYNGDKRATQVVFTDTGLGTSAERTARDSAGNRILDGDGKPKKRRVKVFSPMRDMVERLVQEGIPRNEIAIVDGSTSKDKRKAIADAMNASQIRVVIGSSSSLGVGVNMQRNLRAMHHLDAPYMPGDLEQRNGRGHRQGNQWNTVLEFRYTTDKLDGRRWQILAIKQKFIQDFLKSDNSVRVLEGEAAADEESDILQTFSEASGDPRVLLKVKLEKDLEQLQKKERLFYQGLIEGRKQIKEVERDIERGNNRLAKAAEVNAVEVSRKALEDMRGQAFTMEIDGQTYTERDPATEALLKLYKRKIHLENKSEVLARYGNVEVVGLHSWWNDTAELELSIDGVRFNVNTPTIRGIESALRSIPDGLEATRTTISNQESTLARLQEDQKQSFPRAEKLEKVKKAVDDLERDMQENPEPPPSWLRQGAPTDTAVFHNGNEVTVTGHRWNDRGWFVLAEDKDGASLEIPYLEAKDSQGMAIYDERPFQQPEPPAKTDKQKAKEQEQSAGQGEERYRRTNSYRPNGLSVMQARGIANGLMRDWADRPGITIADTIDQFPAELARKIRDAGAEGDMKAVFWRDNVYVLAPRIPNRQALEEVILHEVIGHYGLHKLLGKELTPFLTRLYKDMGRSERAEEIKRNYFPDGSFNERNLKHRLTVAEELIAHMAESGKHRNPALWERVVAAIRNGLRRLGFKIRITDRDVLAILRGAQRAVENGGISRPSGAELAFRRAYHGTPHKFDQFSLDAIGTGEGVQAFGWGLYFAGRREVAEFYRTSLTHSNITFDDLKPAKKGTSAEKFVRLVEEGNLYLTRKQVAEIIGEARTRTAERFGELAFDGDGEVDAINLFAMEFGAMDVIYRGEDKAYVLRDGSVLVDEGNGEFYAANADIGNLYQVEIPDDDKLLDWDKRLDNQPPGITEAVRAVTDEHHGEGTFDTWLEAVGEGGDYREWSDNLMEDLEPREISMRLAAKGVPGLRYLDGDSRIDAADGSTRNYVIWDEGVVTLQAVNDEIEQAEAMFSRGPLYTVSLDDAIQRVRELIPQVNAAYEGGNLDLAVELDAELDALYDRLEDGMSEVQEDGPTQEAASLREYQRLQAMVRGAAANIEDTESGLEDALASTWSDYIQGYGAMERENVVANGRANIESFGGDTSGVSDERILDVMQDAYENTGQRRTAKRKPKGSFGRRVDSVNDIRFSRTGQNQTAAFNQWFGDSKVVDENGAPLVLYHGTGTRFDTFDGSRMGSFTGAKSAAEGFFFTDNQGLAGQFRDNAQRAAMSLPAIRGAIDALSESRMEELAADLGLAEDYHTDGREFVTDQIMERLDEDRSAYFDDRSNFDRQLRAYIDPALFDTGEVKPVYLAISNPREVTVDPDTSFDDGLITREVRAAKRAGNDGLIIRGMLDTAAMDDKGNNQIASDVYVAFRPEQIRPATGSAGAADPSSTDVMFKRKPSTVRRGVASAAVGKKVSRQLKGKLSDLKPAGLGALPLMYLRDFAPKSMTALDRYLDEKRAMDADRNEMHTRYDAIAQRWLKERIREGGLKEKAKTLAGMRGKEAAALDSLMHDATIAGIDPSLETMPKGADRAQWGMLKARFNKLPQSQKKLFVEVRNAYRDQIKAMEDAIQENIAKSAEFAKRRAAREFQAEINRAKDELTGREQDQAIEDARERYQKRVASADSGRTSKVMMLREKFESMRVEQPYFPLKRFGDYFVALRDSDGNLQSFSMFEKAADMEAAAEELARLHPSMEVTTGRKSNKEELQNAIDPGFVADIQELITEEVGDEALTDAIYQLYLETLPDFSMRKSFIHRKKVPGYHEDAMRAFASTMFHSSHQIARLKHKLEMDELVEITQEQAEEAEDPVDAMTIANELRKRHEWVMNPQGSKIAQGITSAAFVYQLGITPAAALVNTTQTFMLGVPILGTRFKSETRAISELLKASKEFLTGKGHIENVLKGQEREAFNEFMRLGLIDKTQAHDLAGVGETGVEYSAVRHKVMGAISYLFHHAERYNREVTAMAAYRMARKSGMDHQAAIKEAANLTWQTHFDYSSGNRARYMQNDTAKVLLVFRQHSINMLSRLTIDMRQAMKGESKEVRREAWRRLAGIYGMFALGAGMLGVPGAQALLILLNAMDDDDDPWTAEDEIRRAVTEALGEDLAAAFFHGIPGTALDLNLTDRIGMGHLWFFSPYRELEGRDAYYFWMEQMLGAAPAMVSNAFSGIHLMSEGHIARGFETMLPKAGKDLMRAVRYSNEGVQSLNGYSLLDEVGAWGVVAQAMGFMPAHVVEGYERNSALKGAEQRILSERRNILNRYALAVRTSDEDSRRALQGKISEFNRKYPSVAITFDTIRNSLMRRAEGRNRAEGGVLIDKRLNYLRRELPSG